MVTFAACKHVKDADESALKEMTVPPIVWNFIGPSVVLSCDQGALEVFAEVKPGKSQITPYVAKINSENIGKYVKFQRVEDLRLIPDIENTELVSDKDAFSSPEYTGYVYYLKREGPGLRLERWKTGQARSGTYSLKDKESHWYFQSCTWSGHPVWNFKGQNNIVNCKGATIKVQLADVKMAGENRDPYSIKIFDGNLSKKLQLPSYQGREAGELLGLRYVSDAKETTFIREQDAYGTQGKLYKIRRQGAGLVVELFSSVSGANGLYVQKEKLAEEMFQNCSW